jgi:hypothetical protein
MDLWSAGSLTKDWIGEAESGVVIQAGLLVRLRKNVVVNRARSAEHERIETILTAEIPNGVETAATLIEIRVA